MPSCPKCGKELPTASSVCQSCSDVPAVERDSPNRPLHTLDLLPQILCVIIELPLVLLAIFAAVIAVFLMPIFCFVTVPGLVLFPTALVFLIGYRFHSRFTTLGTILGWAAAGPALLGLYRAMLVVEISRNQAWAMAIVLIIILPSIGALADICGTRYRTNHHWKYIALPGAWLVFTIYAYCVYDWWAYCGRV